tara:strand:- start:2159 stop:2476 length:318 start_codon:yes stop_codon:yes gene_type:complete
MNNKSQKLLFIVINFSLIIFQFKKYENKSDLKDLTVHLCSRDYICSKLLNFMEYHLVSFLKKNKVDFLKFKEKFNANFLYYSSSALNKNCVNDLDSLIAINILGS